MPIECDAWVLYRNKESKPTPAELVREKLVLPDIGRDEILATPIYGCWEGNMGHALERRPIDICRARGEEKVVLGNAGVVRVEQIGADVRSVEVGQTAILFCNGDIDDRGYPLNILAYDAPNTVGCLATKMTLKERQLIPLPEDNPFTLQQWAAFSLRYITAWANWELAYGTYRLQVSSDEVPSPNAWGWGGGTTLAELDLARRWGCRSVMLSGNDRRLAAIRRAGVAAIDRRELGNVSFDEERYATDADFRRAYNIAESRFLETVKERTAGRMVQIFVDYVGGPVWRATLRALDRNSVVTTAGWKEGMKLTSMRALDCIGRKQHIHTHYARYSQGKCAVAFGAANGWIPTVDERVYTFDEIPDLALAYREGRTGMYPCFSVVPS
jgi:NADPH:quinone reductase-like Zn-dependent oxidoreductase